MDNDNLKTIKVHIVEDDSSLRKAAEFFMKKNNVQISSSHNGGDAVQEVIVNDPDVVLLDLMLPNKSGYDILEELREQEYDKPVIIATNMDRSTVDDKRLKAAGSQRILIKANQRLEDLLAEIMDAHQTYIKS